MEELGKVQKQTEGMYNDSCPERLDGVQNNEKVKAEMLRKTESLEPRRAEGNSSQLLQTIAMEGN